MVCRQNKNKGLASQAQWPDVCWKTFMCLKKQHLQILLTALSSAAVFGFASLKTTATRKRRHCLFKDVFHAISKIVAIGK